MDPITLMAITSLVSAVPQIYKMGTAITQRKKAKEIQEGLVRPEYSIPEGMMEAVDTARSRYLDQEFPAQDLYEERIQEGAASSRRAAREGSASVSDFLASMSSIGEQEMEGLNQLNMQAAQMQKQEERDLMNALGQLSQFEDRAFQINKYTPFEESRREAAALFQASGENMYSGIKGLSNVGVAALTGEEDETEGEDDLAAEFISFIKDLFGEPSGSGEPSGRDFHSILGH